MNRYSVFYHHVCQAAREKGCTVDAMLDTIRQWGIGYVELSREEIGQEDESIRRFGKRLQAHGLQPSSIYGVYGWDHTPVLPTGDDLLLRQAQMLGSERVMLIPGFLSGQDEGELPRMKAAVCRMAELADAQGLTATIECYDDARSPIATIAGMEDFLDAAPKLYVTLETGNFIFSGDDILQAQQRFAGRIRHVHLKDRFLPERSPDVPPTGEPKTAVTGQVMYPCPVGQGHIPMIQVLDGLDRSGYQGVMTIEHFGAASYWKSIEESIAWLKERECQQ